MSRVEKHLFKHFDGFVLCTFNFFVITLSSIPLKTFSLFQKQHFSSCISGLFKTCPTIFLLPNPVLSWFSYPQDVEKCVESWTLEIRSLPKSLLESFSAMQNIPDPTSSVRWTRWASVVYSFSVVFDKEAYLIRIYTWCLCFYLA